MNRSNVNIMDLPDEMILTVWNKLSKVDVLYSFVGVNKRLNRLSHDMYYTRSIELIKSNSKSDKNYPLTDSVLNRFCLDILPRIHDLVQSLTIQSSFMDRILSAGLYPQLQRLTLASVDQNFLSENFNESSPFAHIFKNQISHFTILINNPERYHVLTDLCANVFARIFSLFTSVVELDFGSSRDQRYAARLNFSDASSTMCFSSSIVRLRINVETLDDCLCLLDGRLTRLRQLVVRISNICTSRLAFDHMVLMSIESFSISSHGPTKEYDNQIVPLLRRMICLEELTLRLTVKDRSTLLDNQHLNNELLIYMPRLQRLTFNLVTFNTVISESDRKKIDQIQYTFYNNQFHPFVCYVDHYSRGRTRSHIYSIPYTLNDLSNISSNFPGGSFTRVCYISLIEIYCAFEHHFFVRIAHSFPLLTHLLLVNRIPQKHKRVYQSDKNDQTSSIVEFSHLTNLTISSESLDYLEQFLVYTNTRLPRLIDLNVCYEQLVTVTENFTRDATRQNCVNIEHLIFDKPYVHSKEFYIYCPSCK